MKKHSNSVRSVAAKTGIAKSQIADLMATGRLTPETVESVAETEARLRKATADDKERAAELKRIKIAEANRELISADEVRQLLSGWRQMAKTKLQFYLLNQSPQLNDGLGAAQQRANNAALLQELCEGMADGEETFLKGLKQ